MRAILLLPMAILAGLGLVSVRADAAVITATYTAVGSGFTGSVAPPYATITESFTITFDTTKTVSQQTTSITLGAASTIAPTSLLAFTYLAATDTLLVGGTAGTVTAADPLSTDFALVIGNASNTTGFSITSLSYSVGQGAVFTASSTQRGTAVPEPASIAALGAASLGVLLLRTRRSKRWA